MMRIKNIGVCIGAIWLLTSAVVVMFNPVKAAEQDSSRALAERWLEVAADLTQRDNETRAFAESVLRRDPHWALPILREKLASGNSGLRQIVVQMLGYIGDASDEARLLQLLDTDDFFLQMNIWQSLPHFYARLGDDEIAKRVRGEFPGVNSSLYLEKLRTAVLFGIYQNEKIPPAIEPKLIELLDSPEVGTHRAVAAVLRFANSRVAAIAGLMKQLDNSSIDFDYFLDICESLHYLKPTGDLARLEFFTQRQSKWAIPAMGVLANAGSESAIDYLRHIALSGTTYRAAAIMEIADIEDDPETFIGALNSKDVNTRQAALNALEKYFRRHSEKIKRTDERFEKIAELANSDPQPKIRAQAAVVYANVDRAAAVAGLREAAMTAGGKKIFRIAAITALGDLAAEDTLRNLSDCAKDADVEIATAAVTALEKLKKSNLALWEIAADSRASVALPARKILYDRTGVDPGDTADSRKNWRQKFIK